MCRTIDGQSLDALGEILDALVASIIQYSAAGLSTEALQNTADHLARILDESK